MPQKKKDQSLRVRTNRASTRATLKLAKPGLIPEIPPHPHREDGWHQQTAAWWRDVWSAPMSSEWHSSDLHNLYVCALLFDDMWRAVTPTARTKAASEFRLQRASLGLTPYDRRRLEWTIETADDAKSKGAKRRAAGHAAAPPAAAGDDPRMALV